MPRPKKNKNKTTVAETHVSPPRKESRNVLDGSESEGEDVPAEAGFKINEEFARRFEHNKKREELHRLEEKYGKNRAHEDEDGVSGGSDDDDSDSESEDDVGVLATEDLDQQISATLQAIRRKDPRVYDGKSTFFAPIEDEVEGGEITPKSEKEEKPMYLKDYHLQNLMSGKAGQEDEPKRKTFVQEQKELKSTVVKEMHEAVNGSEGEDDDDGFLVRKSKSEIDEAITNTRSTEPSLPDPSTADPNNPDEYLNSFLNSRAWAKTTAYPALESDDSEEETKAEQFEKTYNFRFEDPDANVRGSLVSYGRDAVSANTVRREDKSGRKKAREAKREKKRQEKEERERERGRLRKLKTEELMEKFKMIRDAAGFGGGDGEEEVEAEVLEKLLEDDWSDGEWEKWMEKRFGDSYYEQHQGGKLKKPEFDDDIDIGDIVPDFDEKEELLIKEKFGSELEVGEASDGESERGGDEDERPAKKRKGKDVLKDKKRDRQIMKKVEKFVDDNFDFDNQLPASSTTTGGFRYRETTPESYGLTTLDILAADDADLNSYVGLKKLASFRERDKKKKDKKKFGKKKRLREWRKEVFGDEEGVKMPANWKPDGILRKSQRAEDGEGKVDIVGSGDGDRKRKRKRKKS